MLNKQNISGINYERAEPRFRRKGVIAIVVTVLLTMLAIAFVVFVLFNPVKPRPSADQYIRQYNQKAAAQGIEDQLPEKPVDSAAGSVRFVLPESGLTLTLSYDPEGYVTDLTLADDPSRPAAEGWLKRTPTELRQQITLLMTVLDPKMSPFSIYKTFDALGIDLDQPLSTQTAGTHESSEGGMNLKLIHDQAHFTFSIQLDILEE